MSPAILATLDDAAKQNRSGALILTLNERATARWTFYFDRGDITFASGGKTPLRQWLRLLKQHSPHLLEEGWTIDRPNPQLPWVLQLLEQGMLLGKLDLNVAAAITTSLIQEVALACIGQSQIQGQWASNAALPFSHAVLSPQQAIAPLLQVQLKSRLPDDRSLAKLLPDGFSPDLAPFVPSPELLAKHVPPDTYERFMKGLQGKLTLWDIAVRSQKPLLGIVTSLMPTIARGLVRLREVPDLAHPVFQMPKASEAAPAAAPPPPRALIACIDDSPLIAKKLEALLKPYHCELMYIDNPMLASARLIEHPPDLIFMDLMMPEVNGSNLCAFLKASAQFRNVPVIMLTSNDNVMARLRAKKSGCADFVVKMPDVRRVGELLEKYLPKSAGGATSPSPGTTASGSSGAQEITA